MHRCSSSSDNHNQNNSFSMLFSMSNNKPFDEYSEIYPFTSSSSSVDCTLSLGTPSTRLTSNTTAITEKRVVVPHHDQRSSFCWNILQTKHASSPPPTHKNCRGNNTSNYSAHADVLARRCANCDTTSTPLWRNGPRGPKSLCNACGIRFKKEERRATASSANGGAAASGIMEPQHMINNSWVQHSQSHKLPCCSSATTGNEMPFIDRDSDSGIPFLSWRLNVTDRPSLVHDFTR